MCRIQFGRGGHRVELHFTCLAGVEAALNRAVEHIVPDIADRDLGRLSGLAVELAQAFAQMLQAGIWQIADIRRFELRRQFAEGELGKDDPRNADRLAVVVSREQNSAGSSVLTTRGVTGQNSW